MINNELSSFLGTVSGIKYLKEREREREGERGRSQVSVYMYICIQLHVHPLQEGNSEHPPKQQLRIFCKQKKNKNKEAITIITLLPPCFCSLFISWMKKFKSFLSSNGFSPVLANIEN